MRNFTVSDKKILEKILSNTEEVKEVVVTRENEQQKKIDVKKDKRKEQLRDAQKNFIQIKANVKPELYDKIKSRSADGNISKYLLSLIENDFNRTSSLFGSLSEVPEVNQQDSKELETLKKELTKINSMNFMQKLQWLFS